MASGEDERSSDDEPLERNVNIADIYDDDIPLAKTPRPREKRLLSRGERNANANGGIATYSRVERMIEQQLLEDDEKPIWNASDGAVQGLIEGSLPMPGSLLKRDIDKKSPAEPRKRAKKAPRAPTSKARVPFVEQASKKWRFRELESEESSDEEPELKLQGSIDDMVRGAEIAARKAGEDAPDNQITQVTKDALSILLLDHDDEMITENDRLVKKKPRTMSLAIGARARRTRDVTTTSIVIRKGDDSQQDSWAPSWDSYGDNKWNSNGWSYGNSWNKDDKWNNKSDWKTEEWSRPIKRDDKVTVTITERTREQFRAVRQTCGSTPGFLSSLNAGGFRRRNVAPQKKLFAEFARLVSQPGLQSY